MNEVLRDTIYAMGFEDSLVFDSPEYDDAIIGITDDGRVIYEYDKMVDSMMERDHISKDEALDFIEYNTIRALPYFGDKAPIILHKIDVVM